MISRSYWMFLCVFLTTLISKSSQQDLNLTVNRVWMANTVTLGCVDTNGTVLADPAFFRDGVLFENGTNATDAGFRLSLQGNYECGDGTVDTNSTQTQLIIELPKTGSSSPVVRLQCANTEDRSILTQSVSFLNGDSTFELPACDTELVTTGLTFQIDRELEGLFSCARSENDSIEERSKELPIVAHPTLQDVPVNPNTMFLHNFRATAHVDCPITPGTLTSQYYVTWVRHDGIVLYRRFPPSENKPDIRFNDRYTIDEQTFTLYIDKANAADSGTLNCLLGVEDPLRAPSQPNRLMFGINGEVNLDLIIESPPIFMQMPTSQTATAGDVVTFTCTIAFSAYTGPAPIQWRLDNSILSDGLAYFGVRVETHTVMDFVLGDFPMYNNTSTLRLIRVTGAIGGKVYCTTTYKGDTRSARPATLSVIDELEEVTQKSIGNYGFSLVIRLKASPPDPVLLMFKINDHRSSKRHNFTSEVQYVNQRRIMYVLNKEKTVYVAFNLSVAMMIGGDIGPYYKVKGLDVFPTNPQFNTAVAFLALTFLTVLTLFLTCLSLLVTWCQLNSKAREVIKSNARVWRRVMCTLCCCCCCRGRNNVVSSNGFDTASGILYVKAIKASIDFGEMDSLIKPIQEREGFHLLGLRHLQRGGGVSARRRFERFGN